MQLHLFSSTLTVAATVLLLASCEAVQTTQGGAVGVGRQQGNLNRNPVQLNRIRSITNRLIPQTIIFVPDAQKWQWEVNVITSKKINAWCMPSGSGKVAIFSGIIERLQLTDDEVAVVLGHEILHALQEHARDRASERIWLRPA